MSAEEAETSQVLGCHTKVVKEEVDRLKEVGAIKEVLYPKWLANTVVVKKKNGKWRVCVDFTDLNKVCSKDPFPVPKIDQLVDATFGHPRMSFLDTFQGYHQIALAPKDHKDQEKPSFHYPFWKFLLQSHAIRVEECRVHLSKKCYQCQRFVHDIHQPEGLLNHISSP